MSEHDPGLDAIMRTDRFIDALASGARMSSVDPLSSMLGAWRDDVRSRPDAQVVTLAQASAALADAQKPPRRSRFGLTVAGTAAATVLTIGGFFAVVSDAKPGDALYGLRTMLFGGTTPTREAAVSLASQELEQVQQLVQQGQWDQAQQRLVALSPTVQSVNDVPSKQQLVEQYNSLAAKVIQRDPEATPPPPGVPPPVNQSSPLTFLPVPVIEATTTSPSTPPSTKPSAHTTTPTGTLPTPTGPLPTATRPIPTTAGPSPRATVPLPTPTGPLPTATRPIPTTAGPSPRATVPLPTPTGPLPTATRPIPTTAGPSPRATVPLPTPTGPLPTATAPLPTATGPLPTATGSLPTPTATATLPSASAPPPILRQTTTATAPPPVTVTVTTAQPPAVVSTVTTPSVAASSAVPAPSPPKTTQSPASKNPSVVITTSEESANPQPGR